MIRQTLPPVSVLNRSNFQELKALDFPLLVVLMQQDDQEIQNVLTSLALAYKDTIIFATSSDMSLVNDEAVRLPSIVIYNPLDEVAAVYDEVLSIKAIEKFMDEALAKPLIGKFSMNTYFFYTEVNRLSYFEYFTI